MKHLLGLLALVFVLPCLLLLSSCGSNATATNSRSAITPEQTTITVAIKGGSVSLAAGETYQFSATVTGTANTSVTWQLSDCSGAACGSITSTGYYTAPSAIPASATIKVLATSQADPSKSGYVTVRHEPISVTVSPQAAWVRAGDSTNFAVSVKHDIRKGGVSWALSCSSSDCGKLSNSGGDSVLYNAPSTFPAPATIVLTAASVTDPAKSARVNIAESSNNTLAEGDYAFLFSGWEAALDGGWYWPFRYTAAGHFHADGKGNIVNGIEDVNSYLGVSQSVPFSGTYAVSSDLRGQFTVTTATDTHIFRMVLDPSGTRARFIRFDGTPNNMPVSGSGFLERQDSSEFSSTALAGDYAFALSGAGAGHNWCRFADAGRFTLGTAGAITAGRLDRTRQGWATGSFLHSTDSLVLSGSLVAPSATTGRGTATFVISSQSNQILETWNFVYYIPSDDKLLLVQIDPRSTENTALVVLSGEARRQHGLFNAESFKGPVVFAMAGLNREGYGAYFERVAVGQMISDGAALIAGVVDDNGYPQPAMPNQAFHASYTLAPDGRAELQLSGIYLQKAAAYFYGPNKAFLIETGIGSDVMFGDIRPQAAGSFDAQSVSGAFLTTTASPTSEESPTEAGITAFDRAGGVTSSVDANQNLYDDPAMWLQRFDLDGTYDVAPNGRITINYPSQSRTAVVWIAAPNEMVGNASFSSEGWYYTHWAALVEFTR